MSYDNTDGQQSMEDMMSGANRTTSATYDETTKNAVDDSLAECSENENEITTSLLDRNEQVLMTIEKMRGFLSVIDIKCPQIVVVGEQSAGKSSVLESICEIELPRGQTITTRVPLNMYLKSNPNLKENETIIKLADNPAFTDCITLQKTSEIHDHIVRMTNASVVQEGAVADVPIHAMVQRKRCAELVLVDLPGLAYNAEDENILNIKESTEEMIRKYIEPSSVIILVAIEAQRDFGTQEVIKIAKEYDPDGERTLGILTKTDRVESGVDFKKKVTDGPIKFGLGNVCVVNRSPKDIAEGMSLKKAKEKEEAFFKESPVVAGLEPSQWGVTSLRSHIVELQSRAIEKAIPLIREQIQTKIRESRLKLSDLPPRFSEQDMFTQTMAYVNRITEKYLNYAGGNAVPPEDKYALCRNLYKHSKGAERSFYEDMLPFTHEVYESKIEKSEAMVRGAKLPNFLNDVIFKDIFWNAFHPVAVEVTTNLIDDSAEVCRLTLMRVIAQEEVKYFPKLRSYFEGCATEALDECLKNLKDHTDNILTAEKHIATVDSSYENILSHLRNNGDGVSESWVTKIFNVKYISGTNRSEMAISLEAYSILVKRRLVDQIPKLIRLFLVDKLRDSLTANVLDVMRDGRDRLHKIFVSCPRAEAKRTQLERELEAAQSALTEIRSIL